MELFEISLMNLILWVIWGIVVGYIVHKVDPGEVKGGIAATILLGIVGALLGGFLAPFIFQVSVNDFSLEGFVAALVGAFILTLMHRLFFRGKDTIKTSRTQLR